MVETTLGIRSLAKSLVRRLFYTSLGNCQINPTRGGMRRRPRRRPRRRCVAASSSSSLAATAPQTKLKFVRAFLFKSITDARLVCATHTHAHTYTHREAHTLTLSHTL